MKVTELDFNGKTYLVKPTFKLIAKIESAIDPKGPFELAQDLGAGKFKITEIATVIWCMVGEQSKMNLAQVGEIVMEDMGDYLPIVAEFLLSLFSGSDEMPVSDSSDEESEGND